MRANFSKFFGAKFFLPAMATPTPTAAAAAAAPVPLTPSTMAALETALRSRTSLLDDTITLVRPTTKGSLPLDGVQLKQGYRGRGRRRWTQVNELETQTSTLADKLVDAVRTFPHGRQTGPPRVRPARPAYVLGRAERAAVLCSAPRGHAGAGQRAEAVVPSVHAAKPRSGRAGQYAVGPVITAASCSAAHAGARLCTRWTRNLRRVWRQRHGGQRRQPVRPSRRRPGVRRRLDATNTGCGV